MSVEEMMQVECPAWANDMVMEETEEEDDGPASVFHCLNKLPREIAEIIWEDLVSEPGMSTFFALRLSSRALACETSSTFSRRATFYLNPQKDQDMAWDDIDLSPSFVSQIKNLDMYLSKMRYHRFNQSSYFSGPGFHDVEYLEDRCYLLGIMASQTKCQRKKCVLRAEFDGEVFKISPSLMESLECLRTFWEVTFIGTWEYPNDSKYDKVEEQPFEDFKIKLEKILGPAVDFENKGFTTTFNLYPRLSYDRWCIDQHEQADFKFDELKISED